jgi:TetR/AcrR family transcriptional regulator
VRTLRFIPAPPTAENTPDEGDERRSPRTRDADRSRAALLSAAERLFAERGYAGASMADIGAAAGLSRGAPGYFFGSKAALYRAVLQELFAAREQALEPAFAPLRSGAEDLDDALRAAIRGYVGFLRARPAFVQVMEREALDGGRRLAQTPHESRTVETAFASLPGDVDVRGATIAFISLCFFPVVHAGTFLPAVGATIDDVEELALEVLRGLLVR